MLVGTGSGLGNVYPQVMVISGKMISQHPEAVAALLQTSDLLKQQNKLPMSTDITSALDETFLP